MASSRAVSQQGLPLRAALAWAGELASQFAHVALFAIDGTDATLAAWHGMPEAPDVECLSLVEQTPLRWTLEAATPVVGAGRAPGGATLAAQLGLPAPRAYAVVPLLDGERLVALAYVDNGAAPLAPAALRNLMGRAEEDAPTAHALDATARAHDVGQPMLRLQHSDDHGAPGRLPNREPQSSSQTIHQRPPGLLLADEAPNADAQRDAPVDSVIDGSAQAALADAKRAQVDARQVPLPRRDGEPDTQRAQDKAVLGVAARMRRGKVAPPTPDTQAPTATQYTGVSDGLTPDCAARQSGQEGPQSLPATSFSPTPLDADETPAAVRLDAHFDAPLPYVPLQAATVAKQARAPRRRLAWAVSALALGLCVTLLWMLSPPLWRGPPVRLEVAPRARLRHIASTLEDLQLVRQPRLFIYLARLLRLDRHLRAGAYDVPRGLWAWQVVGLLHHGQVLTVQVTVPEGLTLLETAALLGRRGLLAPEAFVSAARDPALLARFHIEGPSAEGFLFPETYRVVRGVSARDMAATMLRQFYRRVRSLPQAANLSPAALYDTVILASLVEREAYAKSELPRVAGVFANRLDHDMRLESCASVRYVLGHNKERLQLEDVRLPSPYNTYLHLGLPPGPIANPGAAALQAALRPERHDFLFFVAQNDGSHRHTFSRTYAEHQTAKRRLELGAAH